MIAANACELPATGNGSGLIVWAAALFTIGAMLVWSVRARRPGAGAHPGSLMAVMPLALIGLVVAAPTDDCPTEPPSTTTTTIPGTTTTTTTTTPPRPVSSWRSAWRRSRCGCRR